MRRLSNKNLKKLGMVTRTLPPPSRAAEDLGARNKTVAVLALGGGLVLNCHGQKQIR